MALLSSSGSGDFQVLGVNTDRIDAAIAIQFKEDMRNATLEGPERVILDLSAVEFIDSSGLGAIVAAKKQLVDGKNLELAGLNPMVEKVMRLTRMDTVFSLHATLEDAIETRL